MRRDWSELAKDAGTFVLDCILSNKKRDTVLEEIHAYLTGAYPSETSQILVCKHLDLINQFKGETLFSYCLRDRL